MVNCVQGYGITRGLRFNETRTFFFQRAIEIHSTEWRNQESLSEHLMLLTRLAKALKKRPFCVFKDHCETELLTIVFTLNITGVKTSIGSKQESLHMALQTNVSDYL